MGPSVSVIVCTKNRAATLAATLRSIIATQPRPAGGVELIVIDNGSTDETAATVRDLASTAPFPVRYALEPRRGVAVARNRALALAGGDIMLCTDDDCIVAPDWVATAARLLADDPLQVLGGRVELFDRDDMPITIKTSLLRERLTTSSAIGGFLHGCNVAFGRAVLERIGRYDARLGPGSRFYAADDTDFAFRAFVAGIPVGYEPDLLVFHHHGRSTPEAALRLTRRYRFSFGAIAMKHLLRGRGDLARICYWDLRDALSRWRAGRTAFTEVTAQLHALYGAVVFLVMGAPRKPG